MSTCYVGVLGFQNDTLSTKLHPHKMEFSTQQMRILHPLLQLLAHIQYPYSIHTHTLCLTHLARFAMVHVHTVKEAAVRGSREHALFLQNPEQTATVHVQVHRHTSTLEWGGERRRGERG